MSSEEKVKSNEKATHGMMRYRQDMSPEEKGRSNEKATYAKIGTDRTCPQKKKPTQMRKLHME